MPRPRRSILPALLLAALPLPCAAQDANRGRTDSPQDAGPIAAEPAHVERIVQFGAAYEDLSGGRAAWRSLGLDFDVVAGNGRAVYIRLREDERFSSLDHVGAVGLRHPLSDRAGAVVEVEISPSHHISPAWGASGQLELFPGAGWGLHGGVRHRRYTAASVDMATATVERYIDRYRAAYTLHLAYLHGADTSAAHVVRADVYYGGASSSVGIGLSVGDELESVEGLGVLRTAVRSASVTGRHWMGRAWFVRYEATIHEQGALYTRHRASVGLGRRF